LYLIKESRDTGVVNNNYVVLLAVARFFRLIFWTKMWIDGNSFISLIIADIAHTLLMGYFISTFK